MECPLTPRQLQIARLTFVEGWSAKELGVKLGISDSTVKQHWSNIRRRLKVRRSAQAVLVCFNAGWLDPNRTTVQSPITYEDPTVMTDTERVYNWAFDQHLAAREDHQALDDAKTLTDAAVHGLGQQPHSIPDRGWIDSLVETMRRKAWPADS
jgi:DNA-binding CsgD family transcriptional regulator